MAALAEAGRNIAKQSAGKIKCKRLLWSEECFWKWNGRKAHTIAFYYLVELCENQAIPDTGDFISLKDNCNVVLGWMPIDELQNVTIYPEFLKKEIYIILLDEIKNEDVPVEKISWWIDLRNKQNIELHSNEDVIDFFGDYGLSTKVERGNRVFPLSQKSNDVIKTLSNQLKTYGATVKLNSEVIDITFLL